LLVSDVAVFATVANFVLIPEDGATAVKMMAENIPAARELFTSFLIRDTFI
jgi:hypothetical protein